jgi:WD40 repeat protein
LWELPSGTPHAICASQFDSNQALAFSADGRTLAVSGFDRAFAVGIWDVSTAERQTRLTDSGSLAARARSTPAAGHYTEALVGISALAFSPNDSTLAAGCSDGVIRLWDVASGDLSQTFSGHAGEIRRLAFAPDGRTLASLGEDNILNLWHVATGQRLFSLDSQKQTLHGLAFSRDGRLLMAGAGPSTKDGPSSLLLWRAEPPVP